VPGSRDSKGRPSAMVCGNVERKLTSVTSGVK
jgi:hypothetical protein